MLMLPMEHYPLLANIQVLLAPRTYLEVGVQHGQSMSLAAASTKCYGIDPEPDIRFPLNSDCEIFRCTSDCFFREKAPQVLKERKIDLAFIDGMHLFEFALRDFINVEKCSAPGSVILVHDTVPINAAASTRERNTRSWCGDVFKLILCLKKYRPELNIANIDVKPSGLAIITGLNPESGTLEKHYEEIVGEFMAMEYDDIESERIPALNIRECTPENIAGALFHAAPQELAEARNRLFKFDNERLKREITALKDKIASPDSSLMKAEVYFSEEPNHFSPERKIQKLFNAADQMLQLEFPEGAGRFLRVDLGTSSAAFELRAFRVFDRSGSPIWEWDGRPDSFSGFASSLLLTGKNQAVYYITLGNDPQLFLPKLPSGIPGRLEISFARVNIREAGREVTAMLQERKKLFARYTELADACEKQRAAAEQQESRMLRTETALAAQKEANSALRQEKRALQDSLDSQLRENTGLRVRLEETERQIEDWKQANELLEEKLCTLQTEQERQIEDWKQANELLEEKLCTLQAEQERQKEARRLLEGKYSASLSESANLRRKHAEQEAVRQEQSVRVRGLLSAYYSVIGSRYWRAGAFFRRILDLFRPAASGKCPSGSCAELEASGLFDAVWYWKRYPEVADSGLLPAEHYLRRGWREGKDPSPRFSTFYYLAVNKDVATLGKNPLLHYLTYGRKEQRRTARAELPPGRFQLLRKLRNFFYIGVIKRSGLFDTQYYLEQNPDIADARMASFWMKLTHVPILSFPARYMVSPIRHYVLTGAAERRNPCPYFDTRAFLARNPEAIAENINPFYLHLKQKENRDRQKQSEKHDYELLRKSPLFDSEYYLQYNADIRRKGADPAWHFLKAGWREGRNPSAAFDVQYYLELNADLVQNGKVENPLLHYLKRGIREKRRIVPAVFPRVMPLEKILNAFRPGDITTLSAASPRVPGKILVVIHLFYEEMLPEFIEYLKNIPYEFDIAISLTEQSVLPADKTLKAALPNCRSVRLVHARNCGRDIGPFLVEFGTLAGEYDYICKIHTKKDLSGVGAGWRTLALRNMLGSEQLVRNILAEFETNASTGMVYPRPPLVALSAVAGRGAWGGNHEAACELGRRAGLDFSGVTEFDFPAGSMFWARSRALKKLLTLPVSYDDFSRIIGWDGSPAHAVERLFGVIPVMEGFSLKSVFVYPPVPEEPPRPYTPLDDDTLLNRIREYKARKRPGNRIAVYTAMAGGYDSIPTPEELDPEVDYICFSDSVLDGEHPWEMRPLDYFNADRTRITRYYKLHPHTYFSGYEHVIWMDSNIQIRRNVIRKLIDTYKAGGNPLATIRHPERNCTYIEAKICGGSRLDDAKVIEAQIQRYREAGLPERNGLPETNIYVTAPDDPRSITLFADWWKELENGSRRDQLSIMYVLYKNGFSYTPLFDNYEDGPRYSSTDFTYFMHKNHENLMFPSVYRYPPFICERKRSITDDLADRTAALPSGDPRLDIIIPVHNALADLKNCLESLMPTLGRSQNVILVNDGSDPETVSFLADFAAGRPEKIRLISHESALGYTVSINEAARLSSADYLVFLNSDTIVPPNWWRKLVRCAESSPDIGIVGPLSNAASWQTVPVLREGSGYCVNSLPEGISVEDADRICEKTARPGFYPKCQLINGFCFFVKRSVFDRIGLFDEKNFPTGYGEEDDLCLRAADAGFISAIAADTYVYHAKSKSFGHAARQELCRQNQLKFLKKHSRNRLERECRTLEEVPELVRMRMLTGDRLAAIPPGRNADAAAADLLKPGNRLGLVPRCGRGEGCYYASSHVRLLDWMDAYTEEGRSVEILKSGSLNKCDFSAYDALVVCRDAVPPEQTGLFLEKCNSAGIPFYMELDDHLFLVPEMEPAWPSLERMVRSAAGVIVSVPALADTFRKLNPNILLKPNCLNRKLWLDSPIPKLDRNSAETISRNRRGVNVIYYGSFTHGQDLAIISKIIPLLKERFDVQFFLVGGCKATELKDSAWIPLCPPVTKYNEFIPWFRAVAETMDIGLAPLDPYKGLNAYKSPLKFLEGGICRLCMICSTLVYDSVVKDGENGLLAEYSGEAWMQALTTAIEDCSLRKRLAERAFTEICETRIIGQDKFQEVFQGKKAEE